MSVELQTKLFTKPPCYQEWRGSDGHPTCKLCYCHTVSGVQCDKEVFGVGCKFCPTYDAVCIGTNNNIVIAEVRNIPHQAVFVFVLKYPGNSWTVVPHMILAPVITEVINHRGRSFIRIRYSHNRQKNSRRKDHRGKYVAKCQVVCGMTQDSFFSRELRMNKIKYSIDDFKVHTYTHSYTITDRKVKCKNCNFESTALNSMEVHVGWCREKDFECGLCDGGFSEKEDLEIHLKTCEMY